MLVYIVAWHKYLNTDTHTHILDEMSCTFCTSGPTSFRWKIRAFVVNDMCLPQKRALEIYLRYKLSFQCKWFLDKIFAVIQEISKSFFFLLYCLILFSSVFLLVLFRFVFFISLFAYLFLIISLSKKIIY